mmetsp:Transcript_31843/g.89600  ORF Transcript_31843/g.89600 Transcript_31843/m.89600 type:complete len:406 (-) Transcript_31843:2-1219(-)
MATVDPETIGLVGPDGKAKNCEAVDVPKVIPKATGRSIRGYLALCNTLLSCCLVVGTLLAVGTGSAAARSQSEFLRRNMGDLKASIASLGGREVSPRAPQEVLAGIDSLKTLILSQQANDASQQATLNAALAKTAEMLQQSKVDKLPGPPQPSAQLQRPIMPPPPPPAARPWMEPAQPPIRTGPRRCNVSPCSQYGQDNWILSKFPQGYRGSFLDIGAHDGYALSNTAKLEEQGWTGVCIEPIPTNFAHRTCHLILAVVSDVPGKAVVFNDCTKFGTDGGDGGLSGISSGSINSGHTKSDVRRCKHEIFITSTVRQVIVEADEVKPGLHPRTVDFASLDVEGAELQVLTSFPFESICVRYWVIEHNNVAGKAASITKFLNEHSCQAVSGAPQSRSSVDLFMRCEC